MRCIESDFILTSELPLRLTQIFVYKFINNNVVECAVFLFLKKIIQ